MSSEVRFLLILSLSAFVIRASCQDAGRSLSGPAHPAVSSAGPLLKTLWGQGCLFNENCPGDTASHETCLHTPAGSGAIAIAQVLKYYGYPASGKGEHGYTHPVYGIQYANFGAANYNYAAMPDTLLASDAAVATLVYHSAVAQDMNFGTSFSASTHDLLDTAFIKFFGYPQTAHWKNRDDYNDVQWKEMLRSELDSGHPLVYAGYAMTGQVHFFICDGYQGDEDFHFNWGNGGAWDGYYSLNNLNPGSANYTFNQSALFGLTPSVPPPAGIVMDFENVQDFSLDFGTWIVNDVDKHTTYGIENHAFPHQNEPMAFLCFNPAVVTPSMASDPAIQPHGGARFGACFSSNPPANDDWFISPKVQMGVNGTFSFWIKSYNSTWGLDQYQVAVSVTGTSPADFTVISGASPLQTSTEWTRKVFNLSAYNNQQIHLAIRCVSNDNFLMMIDDLEIKPQATSLLTADFSSDKTVARVNEPISFTDQSSGAPTSWEWTFNGASPSSSNLQNPSNIRYAVPGTYAVKLKASNAMSSDSVEKLAYIQVTGYPSSMSLDFEALSDFTRIFLPWTVNDVGGGNTYGIQGVSFPNDYLPMAYICFNPSQTIPPLVNMTAHSGQRLGCSFSTTPPLNPNNKWLISPKLSLGTEPQVEFWVKTYNNEFGDERYRVAVSTAGNDPAEFTPVSNSPELAPAIWTRKSYSLGQYANQDVYVGIQCVTDNGFIFMIDDISITSTVGVNENLNMTACRIMPNPVSDFLTVESLGGPGAISSAVLYSPDGKKLRSWRFAANEHAVTIDLRDIDEGVCILHVLCEDRTPSVFKVSVIH